MREPTTEEMVEGIRQAAAEQLDLMRYGRLEERPPGLLYRALHAAATPLLADWLRRNERRLIDAVAAAAEKRGG